jgi:hypothetical protein
VVVKRPRPDDPVGQNRNALQEEPRLAPSSLRGIFDVAADGRHLLMIKSAGGERGAPTQAVVIVENWTEELKRLVPTD